MAGGKDDLIPLVTLDGQCVWVPSKDEAAMAALSRVPFGRKEFGGALFKNKDGEYCYSTPVEGSNDNIQFRVATNGDLVFDGIYHSHPNGTGSDHFSDHDVEVANALNRTSYIRSNYSGDVKRYDPTPSENVVDYDAVADITSKTGRIGPEGTLVGNVSRQQVAALLYPDQQPRPKPKTKVAKRRVSPRQLAALLKQQEQQPQ